MKIFLKLAGLFVGVSVLSACQTTELTGEDAEKYKQVASRFCVINVTQDADVLSTKRNLSNFSVYSIIEGKNGWKRVDMSTSGVRGNLYYNSNTYNGTCGYKAWRKMNVQPDPFM